MKTRNFQRRPLTIVVLTALALVTSDAVAQDSTSSTTSATGVQPAAASQAAPQLSYGVPEVLQLSQAKVGDSVIVNYIQNSGNNYGLNAAQIIYLRKQGVSDTVINTMLNQRSQSAQTASTPTTSSDNPAAYSTQTATTTQPAATYVQTVPTSTVYVVPDTQTYYYNNWLYSRSPYYYFGNYPSYGYCWPYPAVSVSFGWGGYGGGYRGGWHVDRDNFHGGWHGGGGWHRSGRWHH
ncbi:MAG TPA: hypothetical protein VJT54_13260 [Verrucomicrobiae bacterium]|nr:hypothetical protein [Verrucomicrobiae bacterium]